MSLSHKTLLLQFHMNALYIITLSCFMSIMKLCQSKFGINLDGHPKMQWGSVVDRMCPMIVLTIAWTNFLNFLKMKLIKVLNKPNVASIVATHLAQQHLGPLTNQTFSSSSLITTDNNYCGYHHLVFLLHLIKELLITSWEGARSPHEKA